MAQLSQELLSKGRQIERLLEQGDALAQEVATQRTAAGTLARENSEYQRGLAAAQESAARAEFEKTRLVEQRCAEVAAPRTAAARLGVAARVACSASGHSLNPILCTLFRSRAAAAAGANSDMQAAALEGLLSEERGQQVAHQADTAALKVEMERLVQENAMLRDGGNGSRSGSPASNSS